MEPAKTHGIYTVLTSSASETVVFAAFCNTTLYTTTLIVLLLQKQQQLLLLLPLLLRTTTYYYVLCVHGVSLCADTKTMTCRPCWDTHILTYQQTDRQTHRHTYINQYKHIVIPIHGCICVTYPPFGGWGGGTRGGWIIYTVFLQRDISTRLTLNSANSKAAADPFCKGCQGSSSDSALKRSKPRSKTQKSQGNHQLDK